LRNLELRFFPDELIVDSFACGGGVSTGIEMATGRSPDIAINHDQRAISMHSANHPKSKHYISNVWDVDPVEATAGRRIALFWLSPDCTYHSKARGGKPHRDRDRARRVRGLPWVAYRWAKALGDRKPRVIVMENVVEISDWGPIGTDGKPCPLRKGFTFRRFVAMLSNLGYIVDWKALIAADYGAPTTRKRLFLIARCDGQPIAWPEPTHDKHGRHGLPKWRAAHECIDFSIPVRSIFGRKKPLAEATERRIARGISRFVVNDPEPFIVGVGGRMGQSPERPVSRPMQTITAKADSALVVPFLTECANASSPRVFDVEEPLRTQCANVKGGHFALVAPMLIQTGYGERDGQAPRSLDMQKPLGTVVAGGAKHALVSAFLAKHYGGHEATGSRMAMPMDTVTTVDHHALVTSHLVHLKGTCKDGQPVSKPMPTVMAKGQHIGEVRAFLTRYNGQSIGQAIAAPMSTIDTTDRLGLVVVKGAQYVMTDIGMRMLVPRELYNAHGFPADYIINQDATGEPFTQKQQVSMVGNSVPPPMACALVRANFAAAVEERVA
jgi:DNA (cytosine-5)-methyltransferase 1